MIIKFELVLSVNDDIAPEHFKLLQDQVASRLKGLNFSDGEHFNNTFTISVNDAGVFVPGLPPSSEVE